MKPAAAAAAVLLLLFACTACSSGPRGDAPPPPRTIGLRLDQFPDVPIPAGWKPLPGEDHIAVAIANGAVRRLSLAVQAPPARADLQPDEVMLRFVGAPLADLGWTRVGEGRLGDVRQQWRKGDEVLTVTAERRDGRVVIRWRLGA